MARKLKGLRITNVDFVDKGANPGARIALYKRDSTPPAGGENQEKRMAEEKVEVPPVAAELPEDVQKRLDEVEALAKRAERAEADAKALAERVAKMEESKEREQAIRKAAEFTHVAKADDLGAILYDVRKANAETAAKLETILASANAAIQKGALFSEIGSGGESEDTPEGKLDAMAKELMTKRDGLSFEAAYTEVLKSKAGRAAYAEIAKRGRA